VLVVLVMWMTLVVVVVMMVQMMVDTSWELILCGGRG